MAQRGSSLPKSGIQALKGVIGAAAGQLGMDPWHLAGHADKESGLNPRIVSKPGSTGNRAYGLLQLELPTFRALMPGGDPLNPLHNLLAGGTYVRQLIAKYGSREVALAAYNWGPTRVTRLTRALGTSYDRIKAKLPASVRYYVGRVEELALKYQPYWSNP